MDSARPRSLSFYRVRRHCAMDPAWIHDGSDVSDFTKPYVFTRILLGSTMGPRWFPSWDNCETICFHKNPAWIPDGSDLGPMDPMDLPFARQTPHSWFGRPGRSSGTEAAHVFAYQLLGSTIMLEGNGGGAQGPPDSLRGADQWRLRRRGPAPRAAVDGWRTSTAAGRPPRGVRRFRVKSPQLRCLERKAQSKVTFAPV